MSRKRHSLPETPPGPAAGPEPRRAVDGVLDRIREMSSAVQGYTDGVARHLGVHRTDLTAMGVVAQETRQGRCPTAGDLARALGLSRPAVTAVLDRLERVGHVARGRDGVDRRRLVLRLTPHATTVSRGLFTPLSDHLRSALESYDDAELDLVERVLEDLVEAARDAVATPLPDLARFEGDACEGHPDETPT